MLPHETTLTAIQEFMRRFGVRQRWMNSSPNSSENISPKRVSRATGRDVPSYCFYSRRLHSNSTPSCTHHKKHLQPTQQRHTENKCLAERANTLERR